MWHLGAVLDETTNTLRDGAEGRSGLSSSKQWVHLRQQLTELRQTNNAKDAVIEELRSRLTHVSEHGVFLHAEIVSLCTIGQRSACRQSMLHGPESLQVWLGTCPGRQRRGCTAKSSSLSSACSRSTRPSPTCASACPPLPPARSALSGRAWSCRARWRARHMKCEHRHAPVYSSLAVVPKKDGEHPA
jgi:hypothetical protein